MAAKKSQPMHVEIFHTLRARIVDKSTYTDGQLPSELLLMAEFGASRHTVRAALQHLVDGGLIERRRGAGTVIVDRDAPSEAWVIDKLSPFDAVGYAAKIVTVGTVMAGVYPDVAQTLGLGFDQPMFVSTSLVGSAGKTEGVSMVFTHAAYGSKVPQVELESAYMLNLIEKYCGLRANHARQTTTAELASPMMREALNLGEGEPVLVVSRSYYTASGEAIEHSRLYVAGDSYPHVLNFYRDGVVGGARTDQG